ncbi:phage tail tube protein [Gorillibacterium sp. sgz5001074]|uniref:phage tail tube protein n=1 Tax=Gorillibacterium sp. sgz5001074 TaxID=3446695 RepID=UPI003F673559
MGYLQARDTISGKEGRAYATIGGNQEEMFYVKKLKATAEKKKKEINTLGKRATQHKANGWTGKGEMSIYYVTSRFRQIMLDYIKTGKDIYFDIAIVNEDPTSSIGKQTVVVRNVNLDNVVMAALDTEMEVMEEDVPFTFDGVDILDQFGGPVLG